MKKANLIWEHADDLSPESMDRFCSLLQEWKGTRYMPGVCGKQQGVDCARWCASVLAEMEGLPFRFEAVPQDAAFHDPETSWRAVRVLLEMFDPVTRILNSVVRPGYVLIEGPVNGGAAHALIAGPIPGILWHSMNSAGVTETPALLPEGHEIKRIYATQDREQRWLR